ncbi:MAG: hypothetical protein HQL51_01335 [Magnetococcales bacterium]|nr:hypothetical protein [Magnetococcales bacterium]
MVADAAMKVKLVNKVVDRHPVAAKGVVLNLLDDLSDESMDVAFEKF